MNKKLFMMALCMVGHSGYAVERSPDVIKSEVEQWRETIGKQILEFKPLVETTIHHKKRTPAMDREGRYRNLETKADFANAVVNILRLNDPRNGLSQEDAQNYLANRLVEEWGLMKVQNDSEKENEQVEGPLVLPEINDDIRAEVEGWMESIGGEEALKGYKVITQLALEPAGRIPSLKPGGRYQNARNEADYADAVVNILRLNDPRNGLSQEDAQNYLARSLVAEWDLMRGRQARESQE